MLNVETFGLLGTGATGGIFVYLIIKIIWDWLKGGRAGSKNGNGSQQRINIALLLDNMSDLRDIMHNVQDILTSIKSNSMLCGSLLMAKDQDGIPLCYTPRSFGDAIKKAADNSIEQTLVLRHILDEIKSQRQEMLADRLEKKG